jgi:hypothetical protein
MKKSFVVAALILGPVIPLSAQDVPRFNFNIGGGVSTPLNPSVGLSVRLGDKGWKFYMESRYHYAFSPFVATTLIPVTFGIRYN